MTVTILPPVPAPTFWLLDANGRALPERCVACGGPEHAGVMMFGVKIVSCPAMIGRRA